MLIRFIAVSGLAIAVTCFPAGAADEEQSAFAARCEALTGRDEDLLAHLPRESIEDVQRLMDTPLRLLARTHRVSEERKAVLLGVAITVRPVEGLTVERLQRLVRCGLTRAAAADPELPTDWPRMPPGTKAEVYSGGDRFIVILRPRDADAADALWRAAQQLKPSTRDR